MKFYLRRKKKPKKEQVAFDDMIQEKLQPYLRRDEIEAILHKREEEAEFERKQKLWNSLKPRERKRLAQMAREAKARKGEKHG